MVKRRIGSIKDELISKSKEAALSAVIQRPFDKIQIRNFHCFNDYCMVVSTACFFSLKRDRIQIF